MGRPFFISGYNRSMRLVVVGVMLLLWNLGLRANCLVAFAAVSDSDPNGLALSEATYADLLDKLGGTLSANALRQMADRRNPFDVTGEPLRKYLIQFRELLAQKGWNTDAHRDRLVDHLRRRANALDGSQRSAERAAAKLWPDYRVPYPEQEHYYQVTPDGKWIVIPTRERNFSGTEVPRLISISLETGERRDTPGTTDHDSHLGITGDGKYLILGSATGIKLVPLADGIPDWTGVLAINGNSAKGGTNLSATARYFFQNQGQGKIARYDLEKNVVTKLGLAEHLTLPPELASKFSEARFIPRSWVADPDGTHITWSILRQEGPWDSFLTRFAIQEDGKLVPEETFGSWASHESASALHQTGDGRLQFVRLGKFYEKKNGAKEAVEKFTFIPPANARDSGAQVHYYRPGHPQVATIYDMPGLQRRYQLWSTETGELLNSFDLPPHASDFKFTPDGKRLLAKRPQTPELHVLNPDRNSSP